MIEVQGKGSRAVERLADGYDREHPKIVHPRATVDDTAKRDHERTRQRSLYSEGERSGPPGRDDLLLLNARALRLGPTVAEERDGPRIIGDPKARSEERRVGRAGRAGGSVA